MGDSHHRVIDRVHQWVERLTVGSDDDVVEHVVGVDGDPPADQVMDTDRAVGHPEPKHRLSPLGPVRLDLRRLRLPTPTVVAARPARRTRGLTADLEFRRRAVARVRASGRHEPVDYVGIDLTPQRLPVRCVRAADLRSFVPAQIQPVECLEQGEVGLLRVARNVGVLDPEDECRRRGAGQTPS